MTLIWTFFPELLFGERSVFLLKRSGLLWCPRCVCVADRYLSVSLCVILPNGWRSCGAISLLCSMER